MISEGSFLRRIPLAYETHGRMELEAIAFSIDAIYLKHERISQWAAKCEPESFLKTPYRERLELFLDLWSIVDQADALRRLLHKIRTNESVLEFRKIAEAAQSMRNSMDHLSQNIPNIANKKGQVFPVYGVFSFGRFYLDEAGVEIEEVKIYTITAGSLTHKAHTWPVPNPLGKVLDIPVGMFEFSAFDRTLDVSALARSLNGIVNFFDTRVRSGIETAIKSAAEEKGMDAEPMLSEIAGSIATVIEGAIK